MCTTSPLCRAPSAPVRQGLLELAGEPRDGRIRQLCPHLELLAPLVHRYGGGAEHEDGLAHARGGCDAGERLARAARQHDDARPGPAVAEHLGQRFLLVGAHLGGWLELQAGDVRVGAVVAEVVLLQSGQVQPAGQAALLHLLHLGRVQLERVQLPVAVVAAADPLPAARLQQRRRGFGRRRRRRARPAAVGGPAGGGQLRGRLLPRRGRNGERRGYSRAGRRRHARSRNHLVRQQRAQHVRKRALQPEPVLVQHQLHFAVVLRRRSHKVPNLGRQRRLAQPPQHRQDGGRLQADGDGCVEGVRGEGVLVHHLRAAHGLSHGNEEVGRLFVHRREGLEEHAAVGAHPQRAGRGGER